LRWDDGGAELGRTGAVPRQTFDERKLECGFVFNRLGDPFVSGFALAAVGGAGFHLRFSERSDGDTGRSREGL